MKTSLFIILMCNAHKQTLHISGDTCIKLKNNNNELA